MTAVSAVAPLDEASTEAATRLMEVADPAANTRLTYCVALTGRVHLKSSQLQTALLTVTVNVVSTAATPE